MVRVSYHIQFFSKILTNEKANLFRILFLILLALILTLQISSILDTRTSLVVNNQIDEGLTGVKIAGEIQGKHMNFFVETGLRYFETAYNITLENYQLTDLVISQISLMWINVEVIDNVTGKHKLTHLLLLENDLFESEITSRHQLNNSFVYMGQNVETQYSSSFQFVDSELGNYSQVFPITYASNQRLLGSTLEPLMSYFPKNYIISTMNLLSQGITYWDRTQFTFNAVIQNSFDFSEFDPVNLLEISNKFRDTVPKKITFASSLINVEGEFIENISKSLDLIYYEVIYVILSLILLFSLPIIFLIFAFWISLSRLYSSIASEVKVYNLISASQNKNSRVSDYIIALFFIFLLFNELLILISVLLLNKQSIFLLHFNSPFLLFSLTAIYFIRKKLLTNKEFPYFSRILQFIILVILLLFSLTQRIIGNFQMLFGGSFLNNQNLLLNESINLYYNIIFMVVIVYGLTIVFWKLCHQISKKDSLTGHRRLRLRYLSKIGLDTSKIIPVVMIFCFLFPLMIISQGVYSDYHQTQAKFVTGTDIYWTYDEPSVIQNIISEGSPIQSYTSVKFREINTLNHGPLSLFIIDDVDKFFSVIYRPPDWATEYNWDDAFQKISHNMVLIDPLFNPYISDDQFYLQYLSNNTITSVNVPIGLEVREFPIFLHDLQAQTKYMILSEESFNLYFSNETMIKEYESLLIRIDESEINNMVTTIRVNFGGKVISVNEVQESITPVFSMVLDDVSLLILILNLIILIIWVPIILNTSTKAFVSDMVILIRRRLGLETSYVSSLSILSMIISVLIPIISGLIMGYYLTIGVQSSLLINSEILAPPSFNLKLIFLLSFLSIFSLHLVMILINGYFITKKIKLQLKGGMQYD